MSLPAFVHIFWRFWFKMTLKGSDFDLCSLSFFFFDVCFHEMIHSVSHTRKTSNPDCPPTPSKWKVRWKSQKRPQSTHLHSEKSQTTKKKIKQVVIDSSGSRGDISSAVNQINGRLRCWWGGFFKPASSAPLGVHSNLPHFAFHSSIWQTGFELKPPTQ